MKVPNPVRVMRRVRRALGAQRHSHYRNQDIRPHTVLYESFSGNGMLDNPEAIFRALLAAPDMAHLQHIWVLTDFAKYAATIREFADRPNVTFVRANSAAHFQAMATSEYLFNNATFPREFSKRPGQIYINTWHGTPLKRMGFDMPNGPHEAANTMRNFVSADYLLSANPFMTETMYAGAYKLAGIFRGTVIEEGYPRVDRQFLSADATAEAIGTLEASGIHTAGRKVLVYAPTWRGKSFGRPDNNLDEILEAHRAIADALDPAEWSVLLKLHQAAHGQAANRPELRGLLIPNSVPTNVILGLTGILVTDYSSIFFDFLQTGRPIVFYTPDKDEYADSRGLYRDAAELPGPVFSTPAEVAAAVRGYAAAGVDAAPSAVYATAQQNYTPWEDGAASDRIVDIIFRGNTDGYRLRSLEDDGRTSVLLHVGGMRPNGITTSALNLINSIDHTRYDVSITYTGGAASRRMLDERFVDPAIRHFPRVGGMNGSKYLHVKRRVASRLGRTINERSDPRMDQLWNDEWLRCFGDSAFDNVIDFSGYSPFWATLMLHSPPAHRAIWMHNDMAADARRSVNGKLIHWRSLNDVFSHYGEYDALVSVSQSLATINQRNLGDRAAADKFLFAPNTIDGAGILAQAAETAFVTHSVDAATSESAAVDSRLAAVAASGDRVFVTTGRLSPEKNHARLIEAFAQVHAADAATHLLIVGSGPLYGALERLVAERGLDDAVTLTGQQANPYAIMGRASCFVLSSNYEGQPMVLLEAAVLGLPIITVEFPSVVDALPDGMATIVPQSVEGLAAGMTAYLHGDVGTTTFDFERYNTDAIADFYRVLRPHARS